MALAPIGTYFSSLRYFEGAAPFSASRYLPREPAADATADAHPCPQGTRRTPPSRPSSSQTSSSSATLLSPSARSRRTSASATARLASATEARARRSCLALTRGRRRDMGVRRLHLYSRSNGRVSALQLSQTSSTACSASARLLQFGLLSTLRMARRRTHVCSGGDRGKDGSHQSRGAISHQTTRSGLTACAFDVP
jgi:hypothetical protein